MAHSFFQPSSSSASFFAFLLLWVLNPELVYSVHHCLSTNALCEKDPSCSLLLRIISESCGRNYESACAAHELSTCKTALKAIQLHAIFAKSCICTDEITDARCHHFYAYIFKNPCLEIIDTGSRYDERTPSCNYAFKICSENAKCKRTFENFQRACRVQMDQCRMPIRSKCEQSISKLQMTPLYGCHCHTIDERCDRIHQLVHGNPCYAVLGIEPYFDNHNPWERIRKTSYLPSTSRPISGIASVFVSPSEKSEERLPASQPPSPQVPHPTEPSSLKPSILISTEPTSLWYDSQAAITIPPRDAAQIDTGSTCASAKTACETDSACHLLLENVYLACDENGVTCNQTQCMTAIKQFYSLGNREKTFDIAFCNCRPDDDVCLLSQRRLHPRCAFNIYSHIPSCDDIVEACLSADPDCNYRLQRFVQDCAVDRQTFRCKSSVRSCQEARVAILGTPLRASCGCFGNNILSLYKCTEWQRTIWVNPCVVQAQRDYLENRMNAVPFPPQTETKIDSQNSVPKATVIVLIHSPIPRYSMTSSSTTSSTTSTTTVSPTTSAQYCVLPGKDSVNLVIRYGSGKRVYHKEEPDCSSICMCDVKGELVCKVLPCDERLPCQTSFAVYSHASPAYQAYRGRCICYSGNFICMKPSPQLYTLRQGVFLFLGYSELEERMLSPYTQLDIMNSMRRIQDIMEENREENGGCQLRQYEHIGENIIMQAYLEEFNVERENNSITESMVNKEKELCYPLLKNLTDRINANDPDIKKDILMSLFKLSELEVHTTTPSTGSSLINPLGFYFLSFIAIHLGFNSFLPMASL